MAFSESDKKHLREKVNPLRFLNYQDYLKELYTNCKLLFGKYSYLSLANDLGFSSTNVIHLMVQGKRPLTLKSAVKIAEALGLVGKERLYFEAVVQYQNERDVRMRESLFKKIIAMRSEVLDGDLEKARLEFFSEWYHPAIYELIALEDFQGDSKWIADRLQHRIRPEQARKSLQLLELLGLISQDSVTGKYVVHAYSLTTGDEVASIGVVRYHQKMIDLGRESITRVDESERDVGAITVSVSTECFERIKEEIQSFRKKMLAIADESQSKDAVYQMNIQFFPLTKKLQGGRGAQ